MTLCDDGSVAWSMIRPPQPTPKLKHRCRDEHSAHLSRASQRPFYVRVASAEAVGSSIRRRSYHHIVSGQHLDDQTPAARPHRCVHCLRSIPRLGCGSQLAWGVLARGDRYAVTASVEVVVSSYFDQPPPPAPYDVRQSVRRLGALPSAVNGSSNDSWGVCPPPQQVASALGGSRPPAGGASSWGVWTPPPPAGGGSSWGGESH